MEFQKKDKKKQNIYFFLSNLSGGGAQRTIVNIIKFIDRNKFAPKLVLLKYNSNEAYVSLIPKDVEIVDLNSRARNSIFKIKNLIESTKPDILFSTLPQVNFAVWLGRNFSTHKPKLILRETNFRETGFNTSAFKQKIYKRMYKDADHVVGLSSGVTNHMIKKYDLNPSKITTIYNPIDLEEIYKKSLEKCEISYDKKFKLIACGRLVEQKNYSLLINSIKLVIDKGYEDFELFILGEGPEKENLQKKIIENDLTEHIKIIGFQKNPYAYMRQADLFILSSLWEGFGHVIVESMACETPVLATDCPHGPNEILENGKYGWLVPNNSAKELSNTLYKLMQEDKDLNLISSRIEERVKMFDVKKITEEYEKLLI